MVRWNKSGADSAIIYQNITLQTNIYSTRQKVRLLEMYAQDIYD